MMNGCSIQKTNTLSKESGQTAVEFAVVTPVILIIMVIIIDGMVFMSECARFDQLAPQHIIAYAVSPSRDGYAQDSRTTAIQGALNKDFEKQGSSVTVTAEDAGAVLASMTVYRCTFKFTPWPLSAAGAPAALEHTCTLAVDPYTPGELL